MDENRLFEEETPGQFSLCVQVRRQLPDLLEGYLDAMTAEAVRAHLSVCYLCTRAYSEMERTIRLVETLPFAEPVRDLAPQVLAAIKAQPDYCFQAPVVEMETEGAVRVSAPRSITGRQRQGWGFAKDVPRRVCASLLTSFVRWGPAQAGLRACRG